MKVNNTVFTKTVLAISWAALLFWGLPARADVVLSIEPSAAAPGSSGSFDVLLTNTGATAVNIDGFNFQLSTPNPNVTFTDVTTATTVAPYIFPDSLFGPDITTIATGQTVEAGDVDASGNGTEVTAGATYSLGDVSYDIASAAMVGDTAIVSFEPYPSTSLADMNSNNVSFTAVPGTITVALGITPTPEPSLTWVTALLLVVLPGVGRWRKLNRG